LLFAGGTTQPGADHVLIAAAVGVDLFDEAGDDIIRFGPHLLNGNHVKVADDLSQHVNDMLLGQLGGSENLNIEAGNEDGIGWPGGCLCSCSPEH
jgi:hypothetical protein